VAHAPKRKIKNISSIKSLMTSLILQETYIISLWVKECLNMMPSILLDNKHEGLTCCSKLLDLNFRLHTHTHTHTPYGCESWWYRMSSVCSYECLRSNEEPVCEDLWQQFLISLEDVCVRIRGWWFYRVLMPGSMLMACIWCFYTWIWWF